MTRAEHKACDELNPRPMDTRSAAILQLDEEAAFLAFLRDQLMQRPDLGPWQLSRVLTHGVDSKAAWEQVAMLAGLEGQP